MRWLLVLACVFGWASSSSAQTTEPDPVSPLLRRFEQALNQGNRPALTGMFAPSVETSKIDLYLGTLLMPGAVKTTVRLRDRPSWKALRPARAIASSWSSSSKRRACSHRDSRDGYAAATQRRPRVLEIRRRRRLSFVEGLYKLRIDKRPLAARNLEIRC